MKLKHIILSMALLMGLSLTGCSANRDVNSAAPTNSVTGAQNSPYVDHDSAKNSANVGNDAMQGGGAGGTNDQNNDGRPDGGSGSVGSDVGRAADDIGRAAGDLVQGAGDAVRDVGNAVGNAANGVGSAMR